MHVNQTGLLTITVSIFKRPTRNPGRWVFVRFDVDRHKSPPVVSHVMHNKR